MELKMIKYLLICLLFLSSCYYDNQEDLYQYLGNDGLNGAENNARSSY